MPFFGFGKKKKDKDLCLRKTKSTGNIAGESSVSTTPVAKASTTPVTAAATTSSPPSPKAKPVLDRSTTTPAATQSNIDTDSDSSDDEEDYSDTSSLSTESSSSEGELEAPKAKIKAHSSPCTPREESEMNDRLNYINSNDLELLLSMETQARMEAQERKRKEEEEAAAQRPPRPSRLTFALPETPARTRTQSQTYSAYSRPRQRWSLPDEKMLHDDKKKKKKKSKKKRKHKWRIMSDDKEEEEEEEEDDEKAKELKIGDKVKLIHRPLPTLSHVRYIGSVAWAEGDDWVGVELQSRVGKNDGSVDGKRYFQTDPHRGIFVTKSELTLA